MLLWPYPTNADDIRLATYTVELDRKAPGILLRDIQSGKDAQVRAVISQITKVQPDILAIQRFDWDLRQRAATAFQGALNDAGWAMPHAFAPRPNSGVQTGIDANANGRIGRSADTQGYGRFAGSRGMLILSRFPIERSGIISFTSTLWADIPNSRSTDPAPLAALQRLSSVAHIQVPININGTTVQILSFHATPPVFDGPEDRNGRRNADEIGFWTARLSDIPKPFVVLANANTDPTDGQGIKEGITALLTHPAVQDPQQRSIGATHDIDPTHRGDPALDTVDWVTDKPGNMRVSYALPSIDLPIVDTGVAWSPLQDNAASRHRMVWVDVALP
ncbi:MAG: endonuclease/exonuclease/phosphatase family protein [Planktomarina sp.]